ncbi:hypothetical protein PQX77_012339 [Marasmius sp. AFHP31]|nr:hypothetical protein PQX77_012339 [Marasmius sp. AFHP31]
MSPMTVEAAVMMQAEERKTGVVDGSVYKVYIQAERGSLSCRFCLCRYVRFKVEDEFRNSQGFYMGIYAGLGVARAFAMFLMGSTFAMLTLFTL